MPFTPRFEHVVRGRGPAVRPTPCTMNGSRSSSTPSRSRSSRAAAVVLGALVLASPVAASAAESDDAGAIERRSSVPLDLRQSVSHQHRRLLDGVTMLLTHALVRSSEVRDSLRRAATFGMSLDDLVAAEPQTEPQAEPNHPTEEPAPPRRRQRVEFETDTNDPLAGLF